jgi:phosphoglycolate phosphatase
MEDKAKKKNLTLLFDFDGTLADTLLSIVDIVNRIRPEYKLKKIDDAELRKIRKMDAEELIRYSGLPMTKIPFFVSRVRNILKKDIENIRPISGIPEALGQIFLENYEMHVVTSNSKENVEKFLEKNNLEFFSSVNSERNIWGKGKALKNFLKKRRSRSNEVVYLGDEIRDIEAARDAGMRIISVGWGFNDIDRLRRHDPDWLIKSPEEILGIINNL